jgi:glyoxylase-like metal-dependent hydrolase (beta-lactamase superfamily II)
MICPSHGEPLPDPGDAIQRTIRHLTDYYRFQTGNAPVEEGLPAAVSPHLVAHHLTNSSFYAIISSSGKAMFIDYGSASGLHFGNFERATAVTDRIRFVEHSIARLRRDYGLKSVDIAMPSHMHDDHMNGFPHLARHLGTQIWCYENMVDIFQNPRGYNLGCILGEPVKVARSFKDGETFKWEEFEFEVRHSPGHTNYQMAMFTKIDGRKIAFTGDAFFPNPLNDGTMRHNLIFRNEVQSDSHLRSIKNLLERQPEMICPGHGRPYAVTPQLLDATERKLLRQQQYFVDLLPEGETDFGMNPSWLRLYPYQMLIAPGETRKLELHASNYGRQPMKLEVALIAPAEWKLTSETVALTVPAQGQAKAAVEVSVPRDWAAPAARFAIAADVLRDGKYIGQITEAVVEMRGALGA